MKINIELHGDELERENVSFIRSRFPNYETFWIVHVTPLTCREASPPSVLLRRELCPWVELLAMTHYSTFRYLLRANRLVDDSRCDDFSIADAAQVYTTLTSALDNVKAFVRSLKEIKRLSSGERP